MTTSTPFVMGFHPTSRGFGFVLLEDGETVFDWAVADITKAKNASALARLEQLFDKYHPAVLALEAFEGTDSKRSPRIRTLCRAVVTLAQKHKIRVRIFSRPEIAKNLGLSDTATREECAAAVAARLPVVKSKLPDHRRAWDGEDRNMALFCAAACALSCYPPKS